MPLLHSLDSQSNHPSSSPWAPSQWSTAPSNWDHCYNRRIRQYLGGWDVSKLPLLSGKYGLSFYSETPSSRKGCQAIYGENSLPVLFGIKGQWILIDTIGKIERLISLELSLGSANEQMIRFFEHVNAQSIANKNVDVWLQVTENLRHKCSRINRISQIALCTPNSHDKNIKLVFLIDLDGDCGRIIKWDIKQKLPDQECQIFTSLFILHLEIWKKKWHALSDFVSEILLLTDPINRD